MSRPSALEIGRRAGAISFAYRCRRVGWLQRNPDQAPGRDPEPPLGVPPVRDPEPDKPIDPVPDRPIDPDPMNPTRPVKLPEDPDQPQNPV